MTALVLTVFVASLVGSLHCAGMCGGLVALCVGMEGPDGAARRRWSVHAAYHGGRLATYTALGAVSGAIGAAVDLGGSMVGLQRGAAIVAGVFIIGLGVAVLLRARGVRLGCAGAGGPVQRVVQRGYRVAFGLPPVTRAAAVGLLTGFLPCGWLYAFVITAAGTASAPMGALTMAVFWSGTVPVLLAVGVGLQTLAGPLRRHLPTMTAVVLVIVGALTVVGRLGAPAYAESMSAAAPPAGAPAQDAIARVEALPAETPPCCDEH
ncbi:MAG: sulfite exporter TauE/SafE family protein [Planctomycetota bacterium]